MLVVPKIGINASGSEPYLEWYLRNRFYATAFGESEQRLFGGCPHVHVDEHVRHTTDTHRLQMG